MIFSLICKSISAICLFAGIATAHDLAAQALSPIIVNGHLPFKIKIIKEHFTMPHGVHSGATATYHGKWLIFAGRTNGLHGFDNNDNNFPPQRQNTRVYVVDPELKTVKSRSLNSNNSGLTVKQIDLLSVTSPQFYQEGNMLYMTGGYGINSKKDSFGTKKALSAINIPGLMRWVTEREPCDTASRHIRHIFDPIFQVTGGYMTKIQNNDTLLVFGQNFSGYYVPDSNGEYTNQVRIFRILDDGRNLSVKIQSPKPEIQDPEYRRRDLNIIPAIKMQRGRPIPYLIGLSGVFTVDENAWLNPVLISAEGRPSTNSSTEAFFQGMNNYISATAQLFSEKQKNMFSILFGGISLGFFENGVFQTDSELPFINQVTAVKRSKHGTFSQYLLNATFPTILSTQSNPGNPLLFGSGADFFLADNIPQYSNGVVKLDAIKKPITLGYIVGGIQSTLPNTNTRSDSAASPYIFKVKLYPK